LSLFTKNNYTLALNTSYYPRCWRSRLQTGLSILTLPWSVSMTWWHGHSTDYDTMTSLVSKT